MADTITIPEHKEDAYGPDVVDPHIRDHIYALCTALGGPSLEFPSAGGRPTYQLGDEALPVLKDLRQWLRLYDRALNRYDVARCISEMKLVQDDLAEIIAMWKDSETMVKSKHRLVLSCVELLVPLTWPMDKDNPEMTVNHHRHIPVLLQAQRKYKLAIMNHEGGKVLSNIVRVSLPSLAVPAREREVRDEGIINLVLNLMRNLVAIEHPDPTEYDTGAEVGRSATILAFERCNVFQLLLTVGGGIGDEFKMGQDLILLDVLYHLLKGVEVDSLWRGEKEAQEKMGKDLERILKIEDEMKRNTGKAATRHNRFGTTVWMEKTDGTRSFASGQNALLTKTAGLELIDKGKVKKFRGAIDRGRVGWRSDFDQKTPLEPKARAALRSFVEEFIDGCFNYLMISLRRTFEADLHKQYELQAKQYYTVVAWFLHAERVRRRHALEAKKKVPTDLSKPPSADIEETESFAVIGAVTNHEFMVKMFTQIGDWTDEKRHNDIQSIMRCFTQLIYTVQDMAISQNVEDQEIAENMQNRMFYEESMLEMVPTLLRSYTMQPFKWLDDCTEMVHVHLRMLERYCQSHELMFVRSKRRAARKRKQKPISDQPTHADGSNPPDADPSAPKPAEQPEKPTEFDDEMALEDARNVTKERVFSFEKYERKYFHEKCINPFIAFLSYYRELDASQIIRAIKFLHRIGEKCKMDVLIFRMDIVDLIYNMMQGEDCLPRTHPAYKTVDEFARHYFRKLSKLFVKRPQFYVEVLFSKIHEHIYFLQHGFELPTVEKHPRPAAAITFVDTTLSRDEQIGILVATCLRADTMWLKSQLSTCNSIRSELETTNAAITAQIADIRELAIAEARDPDEAEAASGLHVSDSTPAPFPLNPEDDDRKKRLIKDARLRLLLKTLGLVFEDATSSGGIKAPHWLIPSSLTASQLLDLTRTLQTWLDSPKELTSTELDACFRKLTAVSTRRRERAMSTGSSAHSSDDDDGFIDDGDDLPRINRAPLRPDDPHPDRDLNKKPSKPRESKEVSETEKARRKKDRLNKEKEKRAQVKSSEWIVDSDEEADEDFYDRERRMRADYLKSMQAEINAAREARDKVEKKQARVRLGMRSHAGESDDEEEVEAEAGWGKAARLAEVVARRGRNARLKEGGDRSEDEDDGGEDSTPMPAKKRRVNQSVGRGKRRKVDTPPLVGSDDNDEEGDRDVEMAEAGEDDDDEDDNVLVVQKRVRKRAVVVDSDDDE